MVIKAKEKKLFHDVGGFPFFYEDFIFVFYYTQVKVRGEFRERFSRG